MTALPPPGIYVPVPTFFVSPAVDLVDLATQTAHAVYLAKNGIRGLVILGSTGEVSSLTNVERSQILSAVRCALEDAGFQDYPIIAGTATQGIADTLHQLVDAKVSGAQWGLCLAPGYFAGQVTQDGLREWYKAVADLSPIPIMIYHYPAVSNNVKLMPSTIAELSRHPNIVGCKLSHGDVSYHIQICADPKVDHACFRTFTGLGQQLLPVLSVGCAGAIDGAAGFFPRSVVHLHRLAVKTSPTDDEIKERRELQFKLSAVEELVVKHGILGIKEATSRLRGFGKWNCTRLPLYGGLPGGDNEWHNWKDVIRELNDVESILEPAEGQ